MSNSDSEKNEIKTEIKSEIESENENITPIPAQDNKIEKKSSKSFDMNDQNELDYEEELDESTSKDQNNGDAKSINESSKTSIKKENTNDDEESDDGAIDDDSDDGEVKSSKNLDSDDDGEVEDEKNKIPDILEAPATPETEEDGEINDGEKVKKAFIPRVLCKYYQRGKCTWGRTCKFLHPGVNDTGNYSFLEFQDPNAKVYQPTLPNQEEKEKLENDLKNSHVEPVQTESAWERGLRHAREMKEKAKARKLAEKDQFADKKMNLSLKEFENEKENDERYFNVEKAPNVDDEEDEDLHLFAQSGRLDRGSDRNSFRSENNNRGNGQYNMNRSYNDDQDSRSRPTSQYNTDYRSNRQNDDYRGSGGDKNRSGNGNTSSHRDLPQQSYRGGNRSKPDEWHDPWDRSRQSKKNTDQKSRDRSNSYSSSGSDSRSRSHSRSSYSSGSSKSYSSRSSDSSRSPSRSSKYSKNKNSPKRSDKKTTNSKKSLTNDLKKKIESLKNKNINKSGQALPGRQISELSLKKAALDSEKSSKKNKKTRSRSNSSMSSYDSSNDSKSNLSNDDNSHSDSFSDDNDDLDERANKKKSSAKNRSSKNSKSLKRPAQDTKLGHDAKKSKTTSEKPSSDKKQMIKDQLKLLESALKKKSIAK